MNLRFTATAISVSLFFFFLFCLFTPTQAQDVFYEEDFSQAPGWQAVQVVGNNQNNAFWQSTVTNPPGPSFLDPLNSTTAANGFAYFDSAANCNQAEGQDSWLVSPYIQVDGRTSVILHFETFYRSYNDRPQIRVGSTSITDYATWDVYEPFPSLGANDFGWQTEGSTPLNSQTIQIDISPSVIGLDSFRFAFQFLSDFTTFNGGNFFGCAYGWEVDDVKLFSLPEINCGDVIDALDGNGTVMQANYGSCMAPVGFEQTETVDNLYRFELTQRQTVRLNLSNFFGDGFLAILNSDANNIPGDCVAMNYLFVGDPPDEQQLIVALDPGVYWIEVNRFNGGGYTLELDCLPADNPGTISCGESVIGTTAGSPNTLAGGGYMDCLGALIPYGAGDNRYQLTLTETQSIVASLSIFQNQALDLDLDLFLFSNNNFNQPGQCLAASYNFASDIGEAIDILLGPGTYWLIVDGGFDDSANAFEEGAFELSLDCYVDEGIDVISCGQTTIGSNLGQPDNLGGYIDCFPNGTVSVFGAGERIYRFDLNETKDVVIQLESLGSDVLSLFLLANGPGNQPGQCLAIGQSFSLDTPAEILATLTAGTYWIVVDGQFFIAFPENFIAEGPFQLSVDCYSDENISTLSCGQTTVGSNISNLNQRSDYSSCFIGNGGGTNYNAGERRYSFQLSQEQAVTIQLNNQSSRNIDLFLLENGPGNQPEIASKKVSCRVVRAKRSSPN